jgi:hypothetical protein
MVARVSMVGIHGLAILMKVGVMIGALAVVALATETETLTAASRAKARAMVSIVVWWGYVFGAVVVSGTCRD